MMDTDLMYKIANIVGDRKNESSSYQVEYLLWAFVCCVIEDLINEGKLKLC